MFVLPGRFLCGSSGREEAPARVENLGESTVWKAGGTLLNLSRRNPSPGLLPTPGSGTSGCISVVTSRSRKPHWPVPSLVWGSLLAASTACAGGTPRPPPRPPPGGQGGGLGMAHLSPPARRTPALCEAGCAGLLSRGSSLSHWGEDPVL